jgi:hypothetical protein
MIAPRQPKKLTATTTPSDRVILFEDDNEWKSFTASVGNLVGAAVAMFVPFIALLVYLYQV